MVTLQGQRDASLAALGDAARALSGSSDARRAYAASWRPFGETLRAALLAKHAGLGPQLDRLIELFVQVSEAQLAFANDEKRASDDFADIPARYEVVFRLNEEYLKANSALQRATDNLKELPESADPKMEEERKKRTDARLAAREKTKDAVRTLISAREKYKPFKLRKLREGWRRYALGLRKLCQEEASLFTDIKFVLLELKGAVRIAADSALAEQLAAAPDLRPLAGPPAPVFEEEEEERE